MAVTLSTAALVGICTCSAAAGSLVGAGVTCAVVLSMDDTTEEIAALKRKQEQMEKTVQLHTEMMETFSQQVKEQQDVQERICKQLEEQARISEGLTKAIATIMANQDENRRKLEDLEKNVNSIGEAMETVQLVLKTSKSTTFYHYLCEQIQHLAQFQGLSPEPVYASRGGHIDQAQVFSKVQNQGNVAIVAKTACGRLFGLLYTKAVSVFDKKVMDPSISVFAFRPGDDEMPFEVFDLNDACKGRTYVRFPRRSRSGFVQVAVDGVGQLWVGTEQSDSYSESISSVFDGVSDDGLTGRNGRRQDQFYHCEGVVVFLFR